MQNVHRAAEALRDHDVKAGAEREWPAYLAEAERLVVALEVLRPKPTPVVQLTRPEGFVRTTLGEWR